MRGPVEPSAQVREGARELHEMYVALTAEGFTPHQAMTLIREVVRMGGTG